MEYRSKCDSFCDSQPTIISLNSNVATKFNVKSNNGKETLSCLYGTRKVRLLGVIKLAKQWYHMLFKASEWAEISRCMGVIFHSKGAVAGLVR